MRRAVVRDDLVLDSGRLQGALELGVRLRGDVRVGARLQRQNRRLHLAGPLGRARTAVEYLREQGTSSIFTVGFCFGGRNSWLAAADGHGLAGAVGFYGMPAARDGSPGPTDVAAEMDAPILALQAGDDQNITAEHNAAFEQALAHAGVEHEVVTYDGAPHSFFDRKQEAFAAASDDAWRRTLAFIDSHS